MAPNTTTTIILTICIFLIVLQPRILLIQGKEQVPCLFIFGDSSSDNGNNNNLNSLAKVNYLPYGIDYPDGPTGRFASGKNVPDFLAELLGFEKPIPPFATANGREILKGVNYASGAAGILDFSGHFQGDRVTMNQQLRNHKLITNNITLLLGKPSLAKRHLNKCIYISNIGSNDYLNNYFFTIFYNTSKLYTTDVYADLLIKRYARQLETMYKHGARKIVVYQLGLGCGPKIMAMREAMGETSRCGDLFNSAEQLFNDQLKPLVDKLNMKHKHAQFILLNSLDLGRQDPATLGIKFPHEPCCNISKLTWLCERGQTPCSNRQEYAYWDGVHPSEVANRAFANRAYSASLPTDVYPFDIRTLALL